MTNLPDFLTHFHHQIGNFWFLIISIIVLGIICFLFIPKTTDLMVNSAAGLAGKYLGRDWRTLAINSSTNNPELLSMLVAFMLGRVGGIANPLGSNFANIYLMFLWAPLLVMAKWLVRGQFSKIARFYRLIIRERRLCLWHILMSVTMFGFATFTYWCMTGVSQFTPLVSDLSLRPGYFFALGSLSCILAIAIFFFFENRLKANRMELFEEIHEERHNPSWSEFLLGTIGLVASCYCLNSFFLAWSDLYSSTLETVFGAATFAGLHYFIGSLITSLPEMIVAIENYERLDAPDLNMAMASASQSNMTNLAIAALGSLLVGIFLMFGQTFQL